MSSSPVRLTWRPWRKDLAVYATAMLRSFEAPANIRLIADKLEAVERGKIRRLMLFLRHATGSPC